MAVLVNDFDKRWLEGIRQRISRLCVIQADLMGFGFPMFRVQEEQCLARRGRQKIHAESVEADEGTIDDKGAGAKRNGSREMLVAHDEIVGRSRTALHMAERRVGNLFGHSASAKCATANLVSMQELNPEGTDIDCSPGRNPVVKNNLARPGLLEERGKSTVEDRVEVTPAAVGRHFAHAWPAAMIARHSVDLQRRHRAGQRHDEREQHVQCQIHLSGNGDRQIIFKCVPQMAMENISAEKNEKFLDPV